MCNQIVQQVGDLKDLLRLPLDVDRPCFVDDNQSASIAYIQYTYAPIVPSKANIPYWGRFFFGGGGPFLVLVTNTVDDFHNKSCANKKLHV